ncbi:hypothetical protein H4582DRAFT_2112690 [Lactarius indigo]|nr:hypothetical protein H4582DRAFT_2112690 [Lactarius indigo]
MLTSSAIDSENLLGCLVASSTVVSSIQSSSASELSSSSSSSSSSFSLPQERLTNQGPIPCSSRPTCPGAPIPDADQGLPLYHSSQETLGPSIWAPFHSQCDWEIAHWAKTRGPTSSAITDLLAIPEVVNKLELSFRSTKELNDIIDNKLPGRPPFRCHRFVIGGETLEFYYRDVLSCIRSIYGDPEFARELLIAPERHYMDHERTGRVYNEMHTGDWWWAVQTTLESHRPGATVIPVIVSSDKTQLTLFRGKSAYPVYVTIGNIPKEIRRKPTRRAQILVAYIPTTRLVGIANKAARRRAVANLFHSCMQVVLGPIASYGETGVAMMSGDGIWRRCHPIFALFVGDYPEQALVTCTYYGRCPKCLAPPNELGSNAQFPPRDYDKARDACPLADSDVRAFHLACRDAGQKPVYHPFWEFLPLANIFVSITPDILHQLLQGVLKHLIAWLIRTFGPAVIDARCRSIPPNHHITIFAKGISSLGRVSGAEHKSMCRLLLGLIADLPVPNGQVSPRIVTAVRALLDFLYLAQFPSHTSNTLACLDDSLSRFHNNKDVFVDLGVRKHFNIPKIHSLIHYSSSIRLFGTTDNYNTEQMERLHIDFTKDAYRATNHKDEYSQMTTWLERREKVQLHSMFIKWRQQSNWENVPSPMQIGPLRPAARSLRMTRNPTLKAVSFDDLAQKYGAADFQDALADFIAQTNHPMASGAARSTLAEDTLIPFRSVPVYHRIKFTNYNTSEIVDVVHVRPEQKDTRGRPVPSRFDTVLVRGKSQDIVHGSNGHRIAQVRVVFEIPSKVIHEVFPSSDITLPEHLVYVEWFSPIPANPGPNHRLYRVTRLTHHGQRRASIIPVESILRSVHLFPIFSQYTPEWNTFSVLELCNAFYINPFSDRDNYMIFS